MNKKEFLSLIKSSVINKNKPMVMRVRPTKGDKVNIVCDITLITPADKVKIIFVSNSFSKRKDALTVYQFIEQFPIESVYDSFSIITFVSSFNGKANSSYWPQELNKSNFYIKENDNNVELVILVKQL